MNDPFEALKGNAQQKAYFSAQIAAGNLSHAYILEGEKGTGRHTFARSIAYALAAGVPEGEKILRGISPDVRVFGVPKDKKTFVVDVVRTVKSEAYIRANELPFKVFILENTELMNEAAQNAALKVLEEPPADTYFFLLCENASALLPTVRSRAPVIRMQRFSNEELAQLLRSDLRTAALPGVTAERLDAAVKISRGCYGRALEALETPGGDYQDEKVREILLCLGTPRKASLLLAALALPKKRQEFDDALTALQIAFRDMLLVRCGGSEKDLCWFKNQAEAKKYAARLTKDALLRMYAHTAEMKDRVKRNVNMQNAAIALANGLYAAAVG